MIKFFEQKKLSGASRRLLIGEVELLQAKDIIQKLRLEKHPEGGWFRETFRSPLGYTVGQNSRNLMTAIYYLLEATDFSSFHRLASDELWFFHSGSPLTVFEITPEGEYTQTQLGSAEEEQLSYTVKANHWFAAKCQPGADTNAFSLVSCVVAPGFDFADFELAKCEELTKLYPDHHDLISQLTRQ